MSSSAAVATKPLASSTVGNGPKPVVLLHGFLGSGRNLRAVATRWAERQSDRRFLLPDLIGHGASPPPPAGIDVNLELLARAVFDTAACAGFGTPLTLVGHSYGGRVALACARTNAKAIADLVLLDIAPGPIDPARSDTRQVLDVLLDAPDRVSDRRELRVFLLGRGLSPGLADWLMMNLRPDAGGYTWRVDRSSLDRLHELFCREDLWEVVESHTVPVRCIRGGRSSYVGESDVARLRAAGCAVDTLPNAGHFVHVDALDPLIDLLCR